MADRWILRDQIQGLLNYATEGNRASLPKNCGGNWNPDGAANEAVVAYRDLYLREGRTPGISAIHESTTNILRIMEQMQDKKPKLGWDVSLEGSWWDSATRHDTKTCADILKSARPKVDWDGPERNILDLDDSRACLKAIRQVWKRANEFSQLISQIMTPSVPPFANPAALTISDLIEAIRNVTNYPTLDQTFRDTWKGRNPSVSRNATSHYNHGLAQFLSMYDFTKLYLKFLRNALEILRQQLPALQLAIHNYQAMLTSVQAPAMAGDAFGVEAGLNDSINGLNNVYAVWGDVLRPTAQRCMEWMWPNIHAAKVGNIRYDGASDTYIGERPVPDSNDIILAIGIQRIELAEDGVMMGFFQFQPDYPQIGARKGQSYILPYQYCSPRTVLSTHLILQAFAVSGIQSGRTAWRPWIPNADWRMDEKHLPGDGQRDGFENVYRGIIRFPRPFNKTPYVGVYITGFETSNARVDRGGHVATRNATTIRVFAEAVGPQGFWCVVNLSRADPSRKADYLGDNNRPGPIEIGWVAIEPGAHDHEVFMASTALVGPTEGDAGSRVDFDAYTFQIPPVVWCGLKSIRWDFEEKQITTVEVRADRTSTFGTFVTFNTWNGGKILDAEALVIAVGRKIQSFD